MSAYSELKERLKKKGSSNLQNNEEETENQNTSSATENEESGSSYQKLKDRLKGINTSRQESKTSYEKLKDKFGNASLSFGDVGVDEDYINAFFNEASDWLNTAQSDYDKITWSDASFFWLGRKESYEDLSSRAQYVRAFINSNKNKISEEQYDKFISFLDDFSKGSSDVLNAFDSANKYYTQWATQEEYDDYVAYQEDYKAKSSFDLEAGAAEIAELEGIIAKEDALIQERTKLSGSLKPSQSRNPADYNQKLSPEAEEQRKQTLARIQEINAELDEIKAIKDSLAEKKVYYRDAERIQTGEKLKNDAINAGDFEEYALKGANIENPTWDESWGGLFGIGAVDVNNIVTFSRDNIDEIENRIGQSNSNVEMNSERYKEGKWNYSYKFLEEEEVKIYNYYLAKYGEEKASEYLSSLEETLKQREAGILAEMHDGSFLSDIFWSTTVGADSWITNWRNTFESITTDKEYYDPSIMQYVGSAIQEKGDSLVFDIGVTIGAQLPSILIGTVFGAAGGLATMGGSVYGGAYAEMINLGYTKEQAGSYAALTTAAELGLQYVIGGISKLGGKATTGFTTKVVNKIDNAFAKVSIKHGKNLLNALASGGAKLAGQMGGEFVEESLQTILEPWFKSIATGVDFEGASIDEILYSGLLGALSAGVLEGAGTIGGEINTYKAGKEVQNVGAVDRLTKLGKTFAADTVAYQLAGKINENTGAYTIGRLLSEVGGTLTEQNMSDIVKSLERKGMTSSDANTLAKWLNKVVEGETLAEKQKAIIESNEVLAQTINDVIMNQNFTVWQRKLGYAELLKTMEGGDVNAEASKSSHSNKTSSQTASAPSEGELSNSGSISTSTEGKATTILNENGEAEAVSVKEISSIKDGEVIVRLDNGKEVNIKEVDFSTKEEGRLYESVADMNAVVADAFIKGYNPNGNLSVEDYINGFNDAYKYGAFGFPMSELAKGVFTSALSEDQKHRAYTSGKIFGDTSVKNRQDAIDKAKEGATVSKKEKVAHKEYKGETHISKLNTRGLNKRQKTSVKALKVIADAYGINIYFFESPVVNGKHVGKNGYYNPSDKSIHIDLFAGKNGEQVILFTAAHELTHLIRDMSPAKFKIFADFLLENYGKKGISVDELIQKQIEKGNQNNRWEGLSESEIYDRAYEEVIADACETMLTDSNAIEKIAELKAKDETIWAKIKDFITKLVAKIKKVYDGLKPDSIEATYVRKMVDAAEQLQSLWTEALVDAGESYSAIGDKTSEEAKESKLSDRDSEGNTLSKEQQEFFKDSKVRDEKGNLLVVYHGTQNSGFTVFDITKSNINNWYGEGFYFSDNRDESKMYGQRLVRSYLNIKNPYIPTSDKILESGEVEFAPSFKDDFRNRFSEAKNDAKLFPHTITEILKKHGYDGVALGGAYVAFSPEQIKLTTNKNPTSDPDIRYSDRDVAPITNEDYSKVEKHFGTTNNYDMAGYMLKNGKMLDFSGKHWGDDYSTSRQVDHRDIQEVLDGRGNNGVNAMIDMISNGNIRLMPETGGINLAVMPNESQINQLRGYINHFRGEIIIDIDEVGGDTIHSWEYNRGTSSAKILSDIKAYFEKGTIPQQQSSLNQFLYSDRVTDKETLDFLENQEHVTVYRAMQLIDGKLYPPMNAYTYDESGKKVLMTPSEIGAWEQAVERPDLIDKKTGKFKLDKGKVDGGKRGTTVPAAYNPYIHTSLSMLNDQFTSAYTRSNLVVVKGVVPKSELTSGYKAQYAKDSVGETEWHSGVVSTQLPESRKVILSRWFKPVEIMDNDVVAENIKKMLGSTGVEIPYNVVSPKLRRSLEKLGVPIGEGRGIRNLPGKNEVKYSDRDLAPTFYSQMGKVVEGMKQDKFGADSVVSMLRGRGVKAEEIRWSGIVTWLEGKKSVTKQELLEFIAGSQLQIGEQMSDPIPKIDIRKAADSEYYAYVLYDENGNEVDRYSYDYAGELVSEETGEEYIDVEAIKEELIGDIDHTRWSQYKLDGGENYRELIFTMPNSTYTNRAMKAHWGEDGEGVLAHARMQDFNVNGKKMLFIEELQSDWHNEGHSKGYLTDEYEDAVESHDKLYNKYKKLDLAFHKYVRSNEFMTDPEDVRKKKHDWLRGKVEAADKKLREAEKVINSLKEKGMGDVPDSPFKDNYHEYVLKRLLRMAAENSYDSIGWTPADIQSKRWSDEFAEGYRIEYDQDMPKFLSKYGRQWGAKVEKTTAPNGEEIWSMELTDSMKDSVLHEGQVLYSFRGTNKDGIEVYETSDKVKNLPYKERMDSFRAIMEEQYKGRTAKFVRNGHAYYALFDSEDVGKNIYGDKKSDTKGWKAKINVGADGNIFELVENAKYDGSKPESGKKIASHRDVGYWDYFIKTVQIDDTVFDLVANVRKKPNNSFVYSIQLNVNKKIEASPSLDSLLRVSNRMLNASNNSISDRESFVNQNTENSDIKYQERDSDGMSNRSLLANALETATKNDIERNKLALYKEKISLINAEEQKLRGLREQIKELSFAKGRKDTEKIKSLQFEANQAANRINTYDRQLLTLEASKPLKDVLEREKQLAYKKAERMGKEALAAYKERATKTQRELMTRYQEARNKATEGRRKTEMRYKIKGVVADLNKLLLHGTKERNVKLGLQEAVASALEAINMDTIGAAERVAKYNNLIATATNPDIVASLTASRDRIQTQGDTLGDKLEALRKAYSKIKNSTSKDASEDFKEEAALIMDRIDTVIEKVGNTSLRDMSLEQLSAVYDMYKMVLTTIRNANSVWKDGKVEDLQKNASAVMQELEAIRKLKSERSAKGEKVRSFSWNEMTPFYAFDRIGSKTFTSFFWEAIRGQNVYATDINESKAFASEAREKHGYKNWDLNKVHEFKLKDGRIFEVTLKEMFSIYAYSKREQALPHMSEGGFFHNDKATFRKKGGIIEMIKSEEEGYKVDADILADIKKALTSEQIKYVDEMQEYLSSTMAEKGNEVSRTVWGINIFGEKVYFPLKSKDDFIKKSTETAQSVSLKNDGMTKETIPGANNPIVLEAFDDVWASHVDRMSQYHAFVIPIDNLNKIHHYGTWAGTSSMSVSTMLAGRFGSAVNDYLSQFIKDLNGGAISDPRESGGKALISKLKKTAVGASLSTIVQQPTAILRAMAVVDGKYFMGKPNFNKLSNQWEELKKYAPVAIIKDIGGFDAGHGVQVAKWLNSDALRGVDKVMNTIDDMAMKGAELADQIGWTTIWEAVKRETKANNPNLQVGSEAFLKKAGERFTEVIVRTQVYDSVLSRSGFMRSKSTFVNMLTSFMGEPTLSINMIFNAIVNARRGGKGAKLKAARTIGSVYASTIAASVIVSLIYALHDEDEDESYWEKYMQALGGEFISDIVLMPITSLPVVKDIVSIFQGWDVERSDMSLFEELKNAIYGLFSENTSTYRKIEVLSGAVASFLGIPLKNLLRTGREIYNGFDDIFDGIEGGNMGDAFVEGVTGKEKAKSKKLYEAIINGDNARLEVYKKEYEDEDAYNTARRSALRENDSRIKEAAKAHSLGDIRSYSNYIDTIVAEGHFDAETVKGAILSEKSAFNTKVNKAAEAKNNGNDEEYKKIVRELRDSYRGIYSQDEIVNLVKKAQNDKIATDDNEDDKEATSIYSTSDINAAFESGDTAMAKEIIADLIKTKVANGKSEAEAKSSLRSSMTSYWKPLYKEASTSERSRIRKILYDSGLYGTANDVVKTANSWLKDD